jgi:hypothetical protein
MSTLTFDYETDTACFKNSFADSQTHDYTSRGWGHDYTFDPVDGGLRGRMSGWGSGIKAGDFLLLGSVRILAKNRAEVKTTRYQVQKIRYASDPPDMWFADVLFAPRDAT